jgi:hypothetical protein
MQSRMADQGKDVSCFFKSQGRMVRPIQRVNVEVATSMLEELDKAARDLSVSRPARHSEKGGSGRLPDDHAAPK